MNRLAECDQWFLDGTFKTIPRLFAQLYTVHGLVQDHSFSLVFALLPNKTQATYQHLFHLQRDEEPELAPSAALLDFEIDAINALKIIFREVEVGGCYFHLCQNVYKHVQSEDLQECYTADTKFAPWARRLPVFAFVLLGDVVDYLEILEGKAPDDLQPVRSTLKSTTSIPYAQTGNVTLQCFRQCCGTSTDAHKRPKTGHTTPWKVCIRDPPQL